MTETDTRPVFVERRTVLVNNQRRVVPIYRSGDVHFYTFAGRQYTLTDYPAVKRTTTTITRPRTAFVGSSYRDVNLDDDYTVRTLVPIAEGPETVQRTTTTTTIQPEREVVTEWSK